MVEIENTLVSEILFEKKFLCDLKACKGACCVDGDAGAPLEKEEAIFLKDNIDKISPFLRKEGIQAIVEKGVSVIDKEGDEVTSLVNNAECSFVIFDNNGISKCGIEAAYEAKVIDFRKPISCHMYPIRISKIGTILALNYSKWEICDPACKLGELEGLKVFRFLKEAIIRKFGQKYFDIMEEVDIALENIKK